jgi:carbohydrate diacid regulator
MISNQILQNIIDGVKGISRVDVCVMDTEGKAVASTLNKTTELEAAVATFIGSPAESQSLQNTHFFKVFDDHQLEYILVVKGDSDDVYMVGRMVAFQIQSLIVAYK